MSKPALQQVLRRQPSDGCIISFEPGKLRQQPRRADIDDGNFELAENARDWPVFNPGDYAVAFPGIEPRRRAITTTMLCQINRPWPVLANVGHNSA